MHWTCRSFETEGCILCACMNTRDWKTHRHNSGRVSISSSVRLEQETRACSTPIGAFLQDKARSCIICPTASEA